MKRTSLIITFSLFSILIFSQVNKENEKRACELQASSEYICGLGHGNTLKQASNDALAALSSQISTTVSSDFNYLVNSESNGDDVKESVKVDNIIRTYSHTTLRNAMELVIEDEPNATVLRYIKRSDLDKIFEQRRNKVLEYASNAQKYEKENKVADALSSYYAALALLRSLPDGSDMKIRLGFTEETLLMPLIMKNVNDILNNVEIKTEAIEDDGDERTMIINIQYKGKPATNFNYTYYKAVEGRTFVRLKTAQETSAFPNRSLSQNWIFMRNISVRMRQIMTANCVMCSTTRLLCRSVRQR